MTNSKAYPPVPRTTQRNRTCGERDRVLTLERARLPREWRQRPNPPRVVPEGFVDMPADYDSGDPAGPCIPQRCRAAEQVGTGGPGVVDKQDVLPAQITCRGVALAIERMRSSVPTRGSQ